MAFGIVGGGKIMVKFNLNKNKCATISATNCIFNWDVIAQAEKDYKDVQSLADEGWRKTKTVIKKKFFFNDDIRDNGTPAYRAFIRYLADEEFDKFNCGDKFEINDRNVSVIGLAEEFYYNSKTGAKCKVAKVFGKEEQGKEECGEWQFVDESTNYLEPPTGDMCKCSMCGYKIDVSETHLEQCPDCGVKMNTQ